MLTDEAHGVEADATTEAELLLQSQIERGVAPLTAALAGVLLSARVMTAVSTGADRDKLDGALDVLAAVMRASAAQLLENDRMN